MRLQWDFVSYKTFEVLLPPACWLGTSAGGKTMKVFSKNLSEHYYLYQKIP